MFNHRSIGSLFLFTILLSGFLPTGCKEREFNNPVDPVVQLLAPQNLQATVLADTAVQLTWEDKTLYLPSSPVVPVYLIEKSTNGSTYTSVKTVNGKQAGSVTIVPGAFSKDTTYYFRVTLRMDKQTSTASQAKQVRVVFPAPFSVAITTAADTGIVVGWQYTGTFQTGFQVERQAGSGIFQLRGSVLGSVSQFLDTTALFVGQTYTYQVRAQSRNNQSLYGTSSTTNIVFNAPSYVSVDLHANYAFLTWQDNSNCETGFDIEQSSDSVTFTVVKAVGVNQDTATVIALYDASTTYYFGVIAKTVHNGAQTSGITSQITCGRTVPYGGKTYNTVKIGSQCWLKENLDVGTRIDGSQSQTNNSVVERYCYNDDTANCRKYGGLYQWDEAMQYSTTSARGICPSGWHIPTLAEFQTLASTVSNDGNALKAVGQGTGGGAGTNTSGFSALLAGYRYYNGYFQYVGYDTTVWSSTENNATSAYYLHLNYNGSNIDVYSSNYKTCGFSVRCLED